MQYKNMKMPMMGPTGSLSVIGSGVIETKSDLAILSMGVTTESKSVEEAQDKNDKIFEALLTSFSDYGVPKDEIFTEDISVTRNYDYSTNTLISYMVNHGVSIYVTDFKKLSDLYSLAIENGANDNITINFTLSNPNAYYNKALKKATQDAINKASILAKSFGVKYNTLPCKIRENSSSLYAIPYSASGNTAYTPSIAPGLVKITAEVEAAFSTYPY